MSSINGQVRPEYKTIWKAVHALSTDADPDVAGMAETIIDEIKSRMRPHSDCSDSENAKSLNCPVYCKIRTPLMSTVHSFLSN